MEVCVSVGKSAHVEGSQHPFPVLTFLEECSDHQLLM
jgi:hypothetical protein